MHATSNEAVSRILQVLALALLAAAAIVFWGSHDHGDAQLLALLGIGTALCR